MANMGNLQRFLKLEDDAHPSMCQNCGRVPTISIVVTVNRGFRFRETDPIEIKAMGLRYCANREECVDAAANKQKEVRTRGGFEAGETA
jgi:hypothetical protein